MSKYCDEALKRRCRLYYIYIYVYLFIRLFDEVFTGTCEPVSL